MMRAARLIDVRTPMRLGAENASDAPYMPRTSLLPRVINPASSPSRIACALGGRPFRAQWPRRVAPSAAHISETGRLPSLRKMNSDFALFSRSFSRLSLRRSAAIWNGSWIGNTYLDDFGRDSPGVGKTHLTTAIEIEAVKAGKEVRFIDCARLVEDLKDAQSRGILKKRLKYYARSKLLIIDELGYLDIDEGGANLLFQLVSTRYERRSTMITTNVGIGGWAKVFGDEVAASAIADRICHHCHIVRITGRSYRLKDIPVERKMKEE